MDIVLATSNEGKVREIKAYLNALHVRAFNEVTKPFEIEENGHTFQQNALIKARTLYEHLNDENIIVLADDSGISVPILGNAPGIYSARYAGVDANATQNTQKLVNELKNIHVKKTPAFYTCCMAIATKWGEFSVHGFMYGEAIDQIRGQKGFGYDPIFIPQGFNETLGELDEAIKLEFSHRSKALDLLKIILKNLPKG